MMSRICLWLYRKFCQAHIQRTIELHQQALMEVQKNFFERGYTEGWNAYAQRLVTALENEKAKKKELGDG